LLVPYVGAVIDQIDSPRSPDANGLLAFFPSLAGIVGAYCSIWKPIVAAVLMLVGAIALIALGLVILFLGLFNPHGEPYGWIVAGLILLSGTLLAFMSKS
jgi:hypothetical protein